MTFIIAWSVVARLVKPHKSKTMLAWVSIGIDITYMYASRCARVGIAFDPRRENWQMYVNVRLKKFEEVGRVMSHDILNKTSRGRGRTAFGRGTCARTVTTSS